MKRQMNRIYNEVATLIEAVRVKTESQLLYPMYKYHIYLD